MTRLIKWLAIGLAALIGIALLAAVSMLLATDMRLAKTYAVEPQPLAVSANTPALETGRHLAEVYCAGCHGDNLAGGPFFAAESIGYVDAPNLTPGAGGVGLAYDDADWVRAIRHGIRPDGTPLFIMPSADFQHFSDADLAALIAYLKSIPAVANRTRGRSFTPLARILYTAGAFGDQIPAERIEHAAINWPDAPQVGPTAEYGAYIAALGGCRTCHGQDLAGGRDAEPQAPPGPNLTRGGELDGWSETDFVRLMRQGATPGGRQLSNYMPWKTLGRLHDEELRALWLYLRSLPALPTRAF